MKEIEIATMKFDLIKLLISRISCENSICCDDIVKDADNLMNYVLKDNYEFSFTMPMAIKGLIGRRDHFRNKSQHESHPDEYRNLCTRISEINDIISYLESGVDNSLNDIRNAVLEGRMSLYDATKKLNEYNLCEIADTDWALSVLNLREEDLYSKK